MMHRPLNTPTRYTAATLGPAAGALAQFLLSLTLLHRVDPPTFGAFTLILVVLQFAQGISSALIAAPYPVNATARTQHTEATFHAVNTSLAIIGALVIGTLALFLQLPLIACLAFAVYAAAALLRSFARAHAYPHGQQARTIRSDITYASVLLCALALFAANLTLESAAIILATSAVVALIPLRHHLSLRSLTSLPAYRSVWRQHARWSLAGVITTELTANGHAYAVTALLGPGAFAPLAASALLIRPVTLVSNALTDIERPRLAKSLTTQQAPPSLHSFYLTLFLAWLCCALAATALLSTAPQFAFPPHYHLETIATGVALWLLVALLRSLRTPSSVLLQAGGQFRLLTRASLISCFVSITAVLTLLQLASPVWSIFGIALGEAVFATLVLRAARTLRV